MTDEVETAIKVILVGNGAVGKSSLIRRYCRGVFTKDYKQTIGVDFLERQITVGDEEVRLMLWDTAGQEEFDSITKTYYRGAHVGVVTMSVTDRDSYLSTQQWVQRVEEECERIPIVLVLNKFDLMDEAVVQVEEAEELAARLGLKVFVTSVKDDTGIDQIFEELAWRYLENVKHEEHEPHSAVISTGSKSGTGNKTNNGTDNDILTLHPSKRRTKKKKLDFKCSLS